VSDQERVIEARGICNRFGRQVVHENLDLDLYRGEILAVVGGSGSGKSVLLRSIVGRAAQRRADQGVRPGPAGLPKNSARWSSAFGVLFQKGALFSSLTVTENVACR
jgi:phospholipid/cholesterol/gamma-HCH transport system ATP-binding protein